MNSAYSQEIAAREYLGVVLVGDPVIPASMIADHWISQLKITDLKAADFTAGAGSMFGVVPGDIAAFISDEYVLTRAWAGAMDIAGFEGILSRSRFGTGENPTCLYVFGSAGENVLGNTQGKVTMRSIIETMPGYTIRSTPTSDVLVVDP